MRYHFKKFPAETFYECWHCVPESENFTVKNFSSSGTLAEKFFIIVKIR